MDKLTNTQLDQLLTGITTPGEVDSLYSQLLQRVIDRSLEAEMDSHLGYGSNEKSSSGRRKNTRNGKTTKKIKGTFGEVEIHPPRDREGTFEPQLIPKRKVRLEGLDEKIMTLYCRGMTTRDIESAMQDLYGVTIPSSVISEITEAVLEEVQAWQNRPLEPIYPILWMDGIVVKIRDDKHVENCSAHIVMGVDLQGRKDILGIWIARNESSRFWLSVLTELRNRGVQDVYVACMDGLPGLPEAVNAIFPKAWTQRCIVHMVRASLRYVNHQHRQALVVAMRAIYQSSSEAEALQALEQMETQWAKTYPAVVRLWRENWADIVPFFAFPPEIRKITYTNNAIESLNMTLRKLTRNRRIFPSEQSALKNLYLAARQASKKWKGLVDWKPALQAFHILFGKERVPLL